MKHKFTIPNLPDSNFEIEVSFWTGKQTLYKDNEPVQQSTEKGKPFLIPDNNGGIVKAYPKASFPEIVPALEIDNIKYNVIEKLPWHQSALSLLPMLLVFTGGGIGGGIGAVASLYNMQLLRDNRPGIGKYLKVIGVTCAAAALYFALAIVIKKWIG